RLRKLRRQEPSPTPWGTKSSALSPGAERGGKGPAVRRVGRARRAGQTRLHQLPPTSRLRKLRRQEPSPTPWGTKSSALSPGAERGGKGPAVRRVGRARRAGQTRLPQLPPTSRPRKPPRQVPSPPPTRRQDPAWSP